MDLRVPPSPSRSAGGLDLRVAAKELFECESRPVSVQPAKEWKSSQDAPGPSADAVMLKLQRFQDANQDNNGADEGLLNAHCSVRAELQAIKSTLEDLSSRITSTADAKDRRISELFTKSQPLSEQARPPGLLRRGSESDIIHQHADQLTLPRGRFVRTNRVKIFEDENGLSNLPEPGRQISEGADSNISPFSSGTSSPREATPKGTPRATPRATPRSKMLGLPVSVPQLKDERPGSKCGVNSTDLGSMTDNKSEVSKISSPLSHRDQKVVVDSSSSWIARLVHSQAFDYASAAMVSLNSITIGMQTDHMAKELLEHPSWEFRVIDITFCVIFTLELSLRFAALGKSFFFVRDWKWNLFDLFLVVMQVTDELLSVVLSNQGSRMNFSFMRILRMLRLVRIMRMIRILRLISELRTIVASIMGSLKSLLWTMVLLFMLVYVFAVYLTQLVLDYKVGKEGADDGEHDVYLSYCFGTLGRSILSLYEAITGGMDWDQIAEPLMAKISVMLGFVMVIFTALSILALMNVVTGVFVESALQSAKDDRTEYMLNHVKQLFMKADPGHTGGITWNKFANCLDEPFMKEFFDAIDVDLADAPSVFALLDSDDSGDVDLDEFLNGCLGLHGPAKAIHLATLMYETRVSSKFTAAHLMQMKGALDHLMAKNTSGAQCQAPVVPIIPLDRKGRHSMILEHGTPSWKNVDENERRHSQDLSDIPLAEEHLFSSKGVFSTNSSTVANRKKAWSAM